MVVTAGHILGAQQDSSPQNSTKEGLVTISQTKQSDGYEEVFVNQNTRSFAGYYLKTDLAQETF